MSEQRINVKFPSEMKVNSPEIDTINKTTQRISNWLHNDFREIIKPLQVLPKIPEILSDFKEKITEQFSMLFTNMIDTQIVSRHANIIVTEKKVSLVEEHVDKKEHQFIDAKKRITERFQDLSNKLVEMHSKFLKQLDSHAYDIPEKIYPNQIQEKFSYASNSTKNYIIAHAQESALTRHDTLNEGFEAAKKSIDTFLDKREIFYDNLRRYYCEEEEGKYGLPLWAVEVEDLDSKEKRIEVYFDWELKNEKCDLPSKTVGKMRDYAKGMFEYRESKQNDNYLKSSFIKTLYEEKQIPEDEIKRFENDCVEFNLN